MVEKRYEWADGATLEEHSRRKHKIFVSIFSTILLSAASCRSRNDFGSPLSMASLVAAAISAERPARH